MNIRTLSIPIAMLLFASISGCITSKFTVTSDPLDANVYVKNFGSEDRQAIGKTPLSLSYSELLEKTKISSSSGDFFELVVEKKDFHLAGLVT